MSSSSENSVEFAGAKLPPAPRPVLSEMAISGKFRVVASDPTKSTQHQDCLFAAQAISKDHNAGIIKTNKEIHRN